jgi:DNA-binding response OmpR family regulator
MESDPGTTLLDVRLSHLRKKLGDAGPPAIETIRGSGYRIADLEG